MIPLKKHIILVLLSISFCAHAQNTKKANLFTVALDGSGDFTKIQDAVYACPAFPYEKVTIYVKNGIYNEKVRIPEWNTNVVLQGESKEQTIITSVSYTHLRAHETRIGISFGVVGW